MESKQSAISDSYEVEEQEEIPRRNLLHAIKVGRVGSNEEIPLEGDWGAEMLDKYPNGRFRWSDARKVHRVIYMEDCTRRSKETTRMEIKSIVYRCYTKFASHDFVWVGLPFSEYVRMGRPKEVSIDITRKAKIMPVNKKPMSVKIDITFKKNKKRLK